MILELLIGAALLFLVFKPRVKYPDNIPERFTPFRASSVCDNKPNAYNTHRLYMNNPNIYPVDWNYVKAWVYNKGKEFDFLQRERASVTESYAK